MSGERRLFEALIKIRDTTYVDSSYLQMIAEDAITTYKEDTVLNYITKERSEPTDISNST